MLEKVDERIWLAEGECVNFYGFAYPTRSVIVQLNDGGLWVWSPVQLSKNLKDAVHELGTPKYLVSPNKLHYLFLQEWLLAYPDAKLWGPQSTIDKCKEIKFDGVLTHDSPTDWKGEIEQVWFNGSLAMDEIVFFHKSSRTVILADLSENFSEDFLMKHWSLWQRLLAKGWGIVEGKGYAPLEWRLSFWPRKKTQNTLREMLDWEPEKVIMAHGVWQKSGGRAYLEKAFKWVG